MINRTILVGRLTKDVELQKTQSGKSVANFSLAVTKDYKNVEGNYDAYFFQIQVWNASAEYLAKYGKQGDIVGVDGKLESHSYDDRTGNKKTVVQVIAERIKIIHSKAANKQESSEVEENIINSEEAPIMAEELPF